VAYALDTIAKVELDQGHTSEALQRLDTSLQIKRKAADRKGQAVTLLDIAFGLRLVGDPKAAAIALDEVLDLSVAVGARSEIQKAHLQLSELAEERGDLAAALEHFKTHSRIRDELFEESSDIKVRALRVGFEVEQAKKESEIYRLRNVELADANRELEVLTRSLREADTQKTELLRQVERQAREDALTGLRNRRDFDAVVADTFPAHRKGRRPVSIALCDIDNFKRVNDAYGHAVGDQVLRVVAEVLRTTTRSADLVARYGGEEFIIMLPDTSPETALGVCERVRLAVATYDWSTVAGGLRVTLSLGLASDPKVTHHERLISRADELLYCAKAAGKDQVVSDVLVAEGSRTRAAAPLAAAPADSEPMADQVPPSLPAGLTLHRSDRALETVTTEVGSLSLVSANPRLELSEGALRAGGRMTLVPETSEHPTPEAYRILEGSLRAETAHGSIELSGGDTLVVEGLGQPIIFVATTEVRFLYISLEPSFHAISDELAEMRRLAVEVESADGYTGDHCRRIQAIAYAVGRELGLPQYRLHVLDYAAYLHDVGKLRVPPALLTSTEPLSDEDWVHIRRHPGDGAELLARTFMAAAAPIVAQHHERLDGSGYPLGLSGDEILLEAFIVSVADTYDAMTSDRPYRRALSNDVAIAELRRLRGAAFPPAVVDALERVLPALHL
jgi:diguanylate cyclase (GGDEF)-like protein